MKKIIGTILLITAAAVGMYCTAGIETALSNPHFPWLLLVVVVCGLLGIELFDTKEG